MGSGKSVLGRKLANALKHDYYDLDKYIEQKYKMSVNSLFFQFDENIFRNLETKSLEEISSKKSFICSLGGGTPCFNNNIKIIKNLGISIYLKLDAKTLTNRLSKSKIKRPLILNINNEELLFKVQTMLFEREKFYSQADIIIEALNIKVEDIVNLLIQNENNKKEGEAIWTIIKK